MAKHSMPPARGARGGMQQSDAYVCVWPHHLGLCDTTGLQPTKTGYRISKIARCLLVSSGPRVIEFYVLE